MKNCESHICRDLLHFNDYFLEIKGDGDNSVADVQGDGITGEAMGWFWRINVHVGGWFSLVQEPLQVGTRGPPVPSSSLRSEDLLLLLSREDKHFSRGRRFRRRSGEVQTLLDQAAAFRVRVEVKPAAGARPSDLTAACSPWFLLPSSPRCPSPCPSGGEGLCLSGFIQRCEVQVPPGTCPGLIFNRWN